MMRSDHTASHSFSVRLRLLLARPLTVGELVAVILCVLVLVQLLMTPTPDSVFATHPPPQIWSYVVSSPRGAPALTKCMAYEQTAAAIRSSAASKAVARWTLAEASTVIEPRDPRQQRYEAELEASLTRHVEVTALNTGAKDPPKMSRPNYMAAISDWLTPQLDLLQFKARPAPIECTDHAIVMIEGRMTSAVIFVIRHTFYMLRTDPQPWGLILFHTPGITQALVDQLEIYPGGAGEHIALRLIDHAEMSRNTANQLVMSAAWWSLVPVETILLLQSDVLMLKPPASDPQLWHELTHKYVYVGGLLPQPGWSAGPRWEGFGHHEHTPYSGNGGCSIRQKTAHLEILQSLQCVVHVPEPVEEPASTVETVDPAIKVDPKSKVAAVGGDTTVGEPEPAPPEPAPPAPKVVVEPNPKIGECTLHDRFPLIAGPEYTEDEDRFIGWRLFQHKHQFRGRIAFPKEQQQFTVDSMPFQDPFFTHKYWQTWQDWAFPTREHGMRWLSKIKYHYED